MIKKFALAVIIISCIAILTGCHTMTGFGKDVQGLGEKIEDVSK